MTRTIFLYSVMSALLPAAYQTTSSYLGSTLCQCVWSFRPRHCWNTIFLRMGLTFHQAYGSLVILLPMESINTREVRLVSASLALVRGVSSLQDFREVVLWTTAPFVLFYLRDVHSLRQYDTYGIASVVLAQAASALLRGSAYPRLTPLVDRYYCGWYITPCVSFLSSFVLCML